MIVSIALSLFFGLVAAFALAVCLQCGRRAVIEGIAIHAEIAAIERQWQLEAGGGAAETPKRDARLTKGALPGAGRRSGMPRGNVRRLALSLPAAAPPASA